MESGKILHSTQEVVTNNQISEFSSINNLSDAAFESVCNVCLELLLTQPQDVASKVEGLASNAGVSPSVARNLVKVLLGLLRAAAKNSIPPRLLQSDLKELGLSDNKVDHLAESWKNNFLKICTLMLSQTFTVNRLIDLEWKFGVTAASSELEKVGSTFLQLKLVIDCGSDKTEDVVVELSLPQFYEFLHEMEKAKASLDALI